MFRFHYFNFTKHIFKEKKQLYRLGRTNEQDLQRQECLSSSDENRSSGHASMSDTGNGKANPTESQKPVFIHLFNYFIIILKL